MNKFVSLVIDKYKWILLISSLLFLFFVFQAPKIVIDNSVDSMLPADNVVNKQSKFYDGVFGQSSVIMVSIKAPDIYAPSFLAKMRSLTERLDKLDNKILKDLSHSANKKIGKIFDIDEKSAAQIVGYLQSFSIKVVTQLNQQMTFDEMQMMGIQDELAKKISGKYIKFSEVEKETLLGILSPAFVKKAISYINADFVEGSKDTFRVDKLMSKNVDIPLLKKRIKSWSVYKGFLISDNEDAVAIIVTLQSSHKDTSTKVLSYIKKEIAASGLQQNKIFIAGEPVVTTLLGEYMIGDLEVLFPFVIIVVMFLLLVSFRQFGPMIIPLIAVLFSTVVIVGLMAMMSVSLTIISIVLPVLLIAVGSAYGIHVVNHYILSEEKDNKKAMAHSLKDTMKPVAMAAFTTVGGFGALISNQIIPISNFGLYTALGVIVSFIFSVTFVPALLLFFNVKRHVHKETEVKPHPILSLFSRVSLGHNRLVISLGIFLMALAIVGMFKVKVDTDPVRMFKDSSYISQSDSFINKNFNGTSTLGLVFKSPKKDGVFDPSFLKIIDGVEPYLKSKKNLAPYIGGSLSVIKYIKKANKSLHGGKDELYKIPATSKEVLDYMLILKNSVTDFVNREGTMLRIVINLKTGSTMVTQKIKTAIKLYLAGHGVKADLVGVSAKYLEVNNLVVSGQIVSLILSILVIFMLNSFMFKSLWQAVISLVPLFFAILINFATMGFGHILLDVGTSMVATVAMGIGIDYTIHFMDSFRNLVKKGLDIVPALRKTGLTTGRAIWFNMVSVMFGFAVLLFSSFIPLINFGVLTAITMLTTGLASLTLIPALLYSLQNRKFIKKIQNLK